MYAVADSPRAPDNRSTFVDNTGVSAMADNPRAPDNRSRDQPPHLSHIRHHIRHQSLAHSLTKFLKPNILMRDHQCLALAKGLRPCQAPGMREYIQCLEVAKGNPTCIWLQRAYGSNVQIRTWHGSNVQMSKVQGPNANQNLSVPLRVSAVADNPRAPDNLSKTSQ